MGLGFARNTRSTVAGRSWVIRLCALLMLLGMSFGAYAQSVKCSDFGGVLDGSTPGAVNPSQLEVDTLVCIVRNYPRSAYPPDGFIANLQYKPGQEKLVIFDNVYWSGNIACNDVQNNKIWFVNSDVPKFREDCQNVLIPVESINKRGPGFAAIGKGESTPATQPDDCKGIQARAALITCLQPDRRVDVEVTGTR